MHALLIMNENGGSLRVMVRLREKRIKDRVVSLLEGNKSREALALLKAQAEVETYLPAGSKIAH